MKNSTNILIVDNNQASNTEKQILLKASGFSTEVKVAMNAGHALLYLDHIHLSKKIYEANLLIILNMETPISNGFHFLSTFNNATNIKKDRIHIIVLNDNLCEEKKAKIKSLGVGDFVSDSFTAETINEIIDRRFNNNNRKKAVQKKPSENLHPHAASGV